MKYISLFSGIEAATVAWMPLGWEALFFSEIEKFPSKILKHHYPDVPNHGDVTKFKEWPDYANVDVLVGGSPCQSFSVAGLRKGLDDPRGNLMLTYLAVAKRYRPTWVVWENVPGVLSSNQGRDFGTFLGGLAELGYGFAYRVLDAQYFGLAQRRKRVFVVGCLGDWRRSAAVLFERHSLSGNPPPSRKTWQETASYTASSIGGYSEGVGTIRASGGDLGGGSETLIPEYAPVFCGTQNDALRDLSVDIGPTLRSGSSGGTVHQVVAFHGAQDPVSSQETFNALGRNNGLEACVAIQGNLIGRDKGGPNGIGVSNDETMYTLTKADVHAVAIQDTSGRDKAQNGKGWNDDGTAYSLDTQGLQGVAVTDVTGTMTRGFGDRGVCLDTISGGACAVNDMRIRKLMPIECERLQGFPDEYTNIPSAPDTQRYKALGNSMAVPVMRWIGERIQQVSDLNSPSK